VKPAKFECLNFKNLIMEGNFISPNFDSFKNTEVKIIMKTKGVAKEKLNLKDFKSLSHGNDFIVKTIVLPKT
jgi:hypothetical protein